MSKKMILLVALLFIFAIAAGTVQAVNAADDKAKSSVTVQKDDCCKKEAADCKEKAAAKEKENGKEKAGCCSKAKTERAASESKCTGCPAQSACEKK